MNSIKEDCLARWGSADERIEYFDQEYESWLKQMPEQLQGIVLTLLKSFEYYSEKYVSAILSQLHNYLKEDKIIDPYLTAYCPIKTKEKHESVGSSILYWSQYWIINSISKDRCKNSISDFGEDWEYIEDVVFVDDCVGTGETFKDFLEENLEQLKGKHIILVVVHAMKEAYQYILEFAKNHQLNVTIVYHKIRDKAFTIMQEVSDKQDIFYNESRELSIPESLIMGYKNSQALMSFYNNSPNNTLGIFVCSKKTYKGIFPRRKNHRINYKEAKEHKMKRAAENYNAHKR